MLQLGKVEFIVDPKPIRESSYALDYILLFFSDSGTVIDLIPGRARPTVWDESG